MGEGGGLTRAPGALWLRGAASARRVSGTLLWGECPRLQSRIYHPREKPLGNAHTMHDRDWRDHRFSYPYLHKRGAVHLNDVDQMQVCGKEMEPLSGRIALLDS